MILSNPMIGPHGIPEAQNKQSTFIGDPTKQYKYSAGGKHGRFQPFGGMENVSPSESAPSPAFPDFDVTQSGTRPNITDFALPVQQPNPNSIRNRNPFLAGSALGSLSPVGFRSDLGVSARALDGRGRFDTKRHEEALFDFYGKKAEYDAYLSDYWGGTKHWLPDYQKYAQQGSVFDEVSTSLRDEVWKVYKQLMSRHPDLKILSPDQAVIKNRRNLGGFRTNASMNPVSVGMQNVGYFLNQDPIRQLLFDGKEWTPPEEWNKSAQELTPWIQQFAISADQGEKGQSFLKKWGPTLAALALSFVPGMQTLAGTIGSSIAGGASTAAQNIIGNVIVGAGTGGISAGLSGGKIGKGMLTGGITSGIGAGIGEILPTNMPKLARNVATSLGKGAAGALVSGGNLKEALMRSFASGVVPGVAGELGANISPGLGQMAETFAGVAAPAALKNKIMSERMDQYRERLAIKDHLKRQSQRSQRNQRSVA